MSTLLGLPLAFVDVTEGQRHDSRPAKSLVARVLSRCLLADKAYDSDDLRTTLSEEGCVAVIPFNGSRAQKVPYDKELYRARSEIECTFNLLKQARRFATRYEKTLRNYVSRRIHRVHSLVAANVVPGSSFERALMCFRER